MNVTHVSFQYYPGIMYLLTNSPSQRLESKFITINRSVNCTSAPKILLSKSFSILNAKTLVQAPGWHLGTSDSITQIPQSDLGCLMFFWDIEYDAYT